MYEKMIYFLKVSAQNWHTVTWLLLKLIGQSKSHGLVRSEWGENIYSAYSCDMTGKYVAEAMGIIIHSTTLSISHGNLLISLITFRSYHILFQLCLYIWFSWLPWWLNGKESTCNAGVQFSSVAQSCPTLQPHGLQHARLPCSSSSPGAYSNSCPSRQ